MCVNSRSTIFSNRYWQTSPSPPSAAYDVVLGEDANAFFITAENFAQLHDSEASSQRANFA
jgi:hypothetical protein